jgi:hypothetical protein
VKVTFRGARQDLRWIDQRAVKAMIRPKVSNPDELERVGVTSRDVQGYPATVKIEKIVPGVVDLAFDWEVEKLVEVAPPRVTGTPLAGQAKLDYEPRFVRVWGPKRRLTDEAFKGVDTEPVDVDGRVASFSKRVRVISPHDWISQINPPEITVKVNIVMETVTREFTNVLVLAVTDPRYPADVQFDPPSVNLTVEGRAEVLETMARDAVRVYVDCQGLDRAASYELPVNIHLPAVDVKAKATPDTVKVRGRRAAGTEGSAGQPP